MSRKENDFYIGYKNFDLEGSHIKHFATIEYFNNLNINKIKNEIKDLIGIDLETNHKTGELKLLGFFDGEKYFYHLNNFIGALFSQVKSASINNKSLSYWNKLDPFILYKQFLLMVDKKTQYESLKRFGKISGKWDRKEQRWIQEPIIKIKFLNYEFGIMNIIRSSIQFYYMSDYKKIINKVWAYDIANLYQGNLSQEGTRFSYYSKVDESAHLIDWNRFYNDNNYKFNIVLKSNYLDARVVRDLGLLIQEDFKLSFGYYPNTLLSYGSLTRSAIVAEITNFHKQNISDKKELQRKVLEDVKSISIRNYYDLWIKKFGRFVTEELFCMATESYSGGYIETLEFGFTEKVFTADIASAYPSIEVGLYDLRNCKITYGYGAPPTIKNSYCFIRGDIKTPKNLNFNPITVKHPFSKTTNIRATGEYKASYLLSSRNLLLNRGCEFKNEFWINIETKGKITPFAMAIKSFLKIRTKMLNKYGKGDSKEQLAKGNANSGYGITYECTPIYDIIENELTKIGYRAGEFFNNIYASVITGEIRNLISDTCFKIEDRGGKVKMIMTDSIFASGDISIFPEENFKEVKTLGYFEKPEYVTKFMCLGSGRYEYYLKGDKYKGKTRGISMIDLMNKDGVIINNFNWRSLVYKAIGQKSNMIKVNTRVLVSPPMVLNYEKYEVKDLGLVVTESRDIDILAGKSKRLLNLNEDWLSKIATETITTKPLYLFKGMEGKNEIMDFSLSNFRKVMKNIKIDDMETKIKNRKKVYNNNYRKNHKEEQNKKQREKYNIAKKYGFSVEESRKLSKKNWKDFYAEIGKGG